jgi:hypothetical protein
MRKYLHVCLLLLVWGANAQPSGNLEKDIAQLNTAFNDLKCCYYGERAGEPLSADASEALRAAASTKLKSFKGTYYKKFPIFFLLAYHQMFALDNDRYNACWNLFNALEAYRELETLPRVTAAGFRKTYWDHFGIDSSFILKFYDSEFCHDLRIYQDVPCPSKATTPKVKEIPEVIVPEELPKEPKKVNTKPEKSRFSNSGYFAVTDTMSIAKLPNGEVFKDPNPVELLRMVLEMKYTSEHLEIEEMVPGDARLVPGQAGVPYEVRLINAKTKEVIHFEPAKYYIKDESMYQKDTFWFPFKSSIAEFSQLVIWVLNKYGNNAFHVFVQGSADKPTFMPKELDTLFSSKAFTQIDLWKIDSKNQRVTKGGRVIAGTKYNNQDLPDLRGAFVRHMLLKYDRLSAWPDKITQIEGSVKPYDDTGKRNCCIIVYIDWDKALGR